MIVGHAARAAGDPLLGGLDLRGELPAVPGAAGTPKPLPEPMCVTQHQPGQPVTEVGAHRIFSVGEPPEIPGRFTVDPPTRSGITRRHNPQPTHPRTCRGFLERQVAIRWVDSHDKCRCALVALITHDKWDPPPAHPTGAPRPAHSASAPGRRTLPAHPADAPCRRTPADAPSRRTPATHPGDAPSRRTQRAHPGRRTHPAHPGNAASRRTQRRHPGRHTRPTHPAGAPGALIVGTPSRRTLPAHLAGALIVGTRRTQPAHPADAPCGTLAGALIVGTPADAPSRHTRPTTRPAHPTGPTRQLRGAPQSAGTGASCASGRTTSATSPLVAGNHPASRHLSFSEPTTSRG